MSEEVKKRNNFFKDLIRSIKDLEKYEEFALEKPTESFKYILKLILLLVIIITACYTYKGITNTKKIYLELKELLPDFSYKDGILYVDSEEPIIIKSSEDILGTIIIDINAKEENIEQYKTDTDMNLLLLKNKFILLNVGQLSYEYSDILDAYNIKTFTKQEAIDYINNINLISLYFSIYAILFIYIFIIYFIKIFIDIFMLTILTYFISILARMRIKFTPAFNIAIHSSTLPILLKLIYIIINVFIGFEIKYFDIMYYTISYIYVVVAILMIKTDFINRQLELAKIIQEQEKAKEEYVEEKEPEEKKQESDKKNKKKNKEENEKNDEEPKDLGTDTPV